MLKSWLNLCLAVLTASTFYGHQAAQGGLISSEPQKTYDALSGSYTMVVDSCDWGPCVSRVILTFNYKVYEVSADQFQVVEEKQAREHSSVDMFQSQGALTITRAPRTVTAAYLSDAQGQPVDKASRSVTLELAAAPNVGSPFCFHPEQQHYLWADPYQLAIDLVPGSTLIAGNARTQYTSLSIARTPAARQLAQADVFTLDSFTGTQHTLHYASYSPAQDAQQHPLVIWLHGLGEGGTDPTIPLLGSQATVFAGAGFQQQMDGAYVLIPQCPTFWLDDGSGRNTQTGASCYTEDLMALICRYLDENPDIDRSRIYLGGCSNGGYMTMELLLNFPDFFAAAFPVCQAYQDSWITDGQLQLLADVPLWFVHSELDQVCPPGQSTFPTVERLLAAGADRVHLTRLTEVTSPSGQGTDYRYNPHYVWVPLLNGQISDPDTGETLFSWLAEQSLEA